MTKAVADQVRYNLPEPGRTWEGNNLGLLVVERVFGTIEQTVTERASFHVRHLLNQDVKRSI